MWKLLSSYLPGKRERAAFIYMKPGILGRAYSKASVVSLQLKIVLLTREAAVGIDLRAWKKIVCRMITDRNGRG